MSQYYNYCDCGDCRDRHNDLDCEDLDNQIRVLKIVKDLLESNWIDELAELEGIEILEDQEDCDE